MDEKFKVINQHCQEIVNILIVEDSESLANHIKTTIEAYNKIKCDVAFREFQAKELLKVNTYQLIIVDIHLPDSTSDFIAWLIRQKHKIFIMTAKPNRDNRMKLVKLPIVDYLAKTDEKSLTRYLCDTIKRLNENLKSLVLVCDDSRISRRYIASVLVNQNIPYLEVNDGSEALKYISAEKSNVDLLISDYEMPNMDGLELTRYVRLQYSPLELPILIQSAKSESYDIANMLKAGANDYIKKPLFIEEFLVRINTLLDYSRAYLKNKILTEKLQVIAMKDNLTGLHNRNYFYECIDKVIAQAQREKSSYGIIVFDIDNFKTLNDSYGHDFGDVVLKEVANTLKEFSRATDVVFRWGGEEFIILSPKNNELSTIILAERMRKAILKLEVKEPETQKNISVSISGGIAIGNENDFENVIKLADTRLYAAKRTGKNKIIYEGT